MRLFVSPFYFSSDPSKLSAFFELIGLQSLITSGDGYAFMKGAVGFLAVHGVPAEFGQAGEAHMVFAIDSYEGFKEAMAKQGLMVEQWDESWGKQAGVLDPDSAGIWIKTISHDLYGYETREAEAATHQVEVVMVKYSNDFDRDRTFFAQLGFESLPGADKWWEQLRLDDTSGSIGLHRPSGSELTYRDEPNNPLGNKVPLVGISLQTSEDLDCLAARLTEAGYPAQVITEASATKVHVNDPEGNPLEIHPMSSTQRSFPSLVSGVGMPLILRLAL